SPVPRLIVAGIAGANGHVLLARVDLNLGLFEPLLGVGALDGVDFHFVPLPAGDVYRPVNVVEFDASVRCKHVGLMELFGQRSTMFGSVCPQSENEQCADGPENCAQPGGKITSAVHDFLRFKALDEATS